MKQVMKRLTALLLVGIMVISMIPELTVKAAGNANIQCVFKCGANVTGVLDITGTLTLTGTGSTYEGDSGKNWINSFWYGDKDKNGFETYQYYSCQSRLYWYLNLLRNIQRYHLHKHNLKFL